MRRTNRNNTTPNISKRILLLMTLLMVIFFITTIVQGKKIDELWESETINIDLTDGTWTECFKSDEIDVYMKYIYYRWHTLEESRYRGEDDHGYSLEYVHHQRHSVIIYTVNKTDNYITLISDVKDSNGNTIMTSQCVSQPNKNEYLAEPFFGETDEEINSNESVVFDTVVLRGNPDAYMRIRDYNRGEFNPNRILKNFSGTANWKDETLQLK